MFLKKLHTVGFTASNLFVKIKFFSTPKSRNMKITSYYVLIAASVLLANCSETIEENGGTNTPSLPPVESNAANTNYQPAFAGQTRANGAKTSTPYVSEVVTSALASPWGITALPDGRLLITEKAGTMRIVSSTGTLSNAITGLPSVNSGGQGGLLGLCVDPQFTSNRMVYWLFSENVSGGNITSVAKGRLSNSETTIENPTVIYRANPSAMSEIFTTEEELFLIIQEIFL